MHICIPPLSFSSPFPSQRSNLPRVLVVSNLPNQVLPNRISSRLDQLSDNCGGKVLSVNPRLGTARVLFRTPEWATK